MQHGHDATAGNELVTTLLCCQRDRTFAATLHTLIFPTCLSEETGDEMNEEKEVRRGRPKNLADRKKLHCKALFNPTSGFATGGRVRFRH